MKNKTLIVLLLISSLFTGMGCAGNWFVDITSNRDSCYHQSTSNFDYAYRMGSNYNNGIGPRPVYPVSTIVYTPWVRYSGPVPEYIYRDPKAIVRNYGSYYEVCYANYRY
jgi:hypothetical protein